MNDHTCAIMAGIPSEIAAEVQRAFEEQRLLIQKYLKELKDEGFTDTMYDTPYLRWEDMARYAVNGNLSCWGPDIADVQARYTTEGMFVIMKNGQMAATITDAALSQCLKRAQATSTATCWMLATDLKEHYAYNTRDGIRITTHDGLEVRVEVKESWAARGVAVTPEAASKIDECISGDVCKRFLHNGRQVWALPDGAGLATLHNYADQGSVDPASKVKVPLLVEVASGKVRDDLAAVFTGRALNQVAKMPFSETFMLDKASTTISTVVAHEGKFTILNYGGVGLHAQVKYSPGFDLPLFTIRSPKMNERLSAVSLDRAKVRVGDKMLTLSDVAKRAGEVAGKFGLADSADLSAETDNAPVNTIRFQATIVPGSRKEGATEVYETIYNYQTMHEMRPTALYSYHTSFGTTFASAGQHAIKIQPCTYDGNKLSAFNLRVEASKKLVGDDATYTQEDNQENVDAGFGTAIPLGPLGFPKVANATMLCQWPVVATNEPESDPKPFDDDDQEKSDDLDDDDDFPVYRSVRADPPTAPTAKGLFASRCGLGSYQGEARGIKNPDLARRTNAKPTITYNRFYSLQPRVETAVERNLPGMYTVTKDEVKKIVKMLDEMYEIAGKSHHLADPDAVSVVHVSGPEFNEAPLGAGFSVKAAEATDGSEAVEHSRIELEEIKRPRLMVPEL